VTGYGSARDLFAGRFSLSVPSALPVATPFPIHRNTLGFFAASHQDVHHHLSTHGLIMEKTADVEVT
jgi:hypothetical protein